MDFWDFFGDFWGFISKLPSLLLKVAEVNNDHQQLPRISSFFTQSPPQELEESPHSGLYLLVSIKEVQVFKGEPLLVQNSIFL